jgi:hypothetical protein
MWSVLGLHHLIVPVIIIAFKKNQDIFMAFSKLDDISGVSIFQIKNHSRDTGRTTSSLNFLSNQWYKKM